jgi:hypothetical protein
LGRWLTLAAAGLAGLALGACGGDSEEEYRDEFQPINQEVLKLGEQVGETIEGAGDVSDAQLAEDFGDYAQELGDLQQDLDELEPPDDLAEEQDDLVAAMGEVQGPLEDIAAAAEEGDPQAATEATEDLIQRSLDLRDARRALARAVREL